MCIILNVQNDTLAEKYKKDPVKFIKMSNDDINELQNMLGLPLSDTLSGIVWRSKKDLAYGIGLNANHSDAVSNALSGVADFKAVNQI